MNTTLSTWILGGAVLASAGALAQATPSQSQNTGRVLIRVAPASADEPELGLHVGGFFEPGEEFSADHWLYKLTDGDLAQRELNFEAMVRLARRSDEARAWLEERIADTADPELAWTARLALREAGAKQRFFMRSHPGHQGSQRNSPQPSSLRNLLQGGGIDLHFGLGQEGLFQGSQPQGTRSVLERHGVTLESNPDGVKMTVTQTIDGEEQSTLYEAESLEALYQAHPELRDKAGAGHLFQLRFGDASFELNGSGLEQLFSDDGFGLFGRLAPTTPTARGARGATPPPSVPTDILGVYVGEPSAELAEQLGLEPGRGLVVHRTEPGTIAGLLGISHGDVLLSINGVEMDGNSRISEILAARSADGELTLVWLDPRGEQQRRTWVPAPVAAD